MSRKKKVVLTGGPGAGKTAVLELCQRTFPEHVRVLPESASIVFKGGFPREQTDSAKRAAQRAIFHVQSELERYAEDANQAQLVLCDRGTLDGLAYWPGSEETFFAELGTTCAEELARYDAVIHLRTPTRANGYHKDPVRIESARQAAIIDARLLTVWEKHPRRIIVESVKDFLEKAHRTIALLNAELPEEFRFGYHPKADG